MKKIGIFYGSSTGSTSDLAQKIAKELNAEANVFDIANCSASDLLAYDVLLLGSSTWGMEIFKAIGRPCCPSWESKT